MGHGKNESLNLLGYHLVLPVVLQQALEAHVAVAAQVVERVGGDLSALKAIEVRAIPSAANSIDKVVVEEEESSVRVGGHLAEVELYYVVPLVMVSVDNIGVVLKGDFHSLSSLHDSIEVVQRHCS